MDGKNVIVLLLLCLISQTAIGQSRQLIVLKNEQILARYQAGDIIYFAGANHKEIQVQRILDFNDTLIMMSEDSIVYYKIKKLDLRERKKTTFLQKLGATMMLAGVVLPAAEIVNTGLVQKDDVSISRGVTTTSFTLLAVGSAFSFIKKPYFKPGRKYRLLIVDKRSPFYKQKPVPEGYESPYLPK